MKIVKDRQTYLLFTLILGVFLISGCGGGGKTGHWLPGLPGEITPPTVISTVPANNDNGVAINSAVNAMFNEAMDPATIDNQTFRVTRTDNTAVSVLGDVTPSGVNAVFIPRINLDINTSYTATITTGARNLEGNALASNHVWRFTTGATADNTAPIVLSTVPVDNAINVPVNQALTVTFNKDMNPATIDNQTFRVKRTSDNAVVSGTVTSPSTISATFSPRSNLDNNTNYTATITTGAQDLAGNPLASDNVWTFTTSAAPPGPGPAAVTLGSTLRRYAIIAGSAITNTGPTIITGAASTADIGVSPGSSVSGFPPGTYDGTRHTADPDAAQAKLELTTAYNDAQGRTLAPITKSGNLGGQTLAPGLYKSTSSLAISSGNLTLAGPADGVWIFQMASTLTTTPGRQVILSGGALAKNIFWAVGSSATLGTTSVFYGNIMADQSITLETGAVLNGRALTRIGAVTLDDNDITMPAP